ncbi:hypothetical protein [Roseinatronobacter sp. NSM]|uniref:hypothetical protein n=1 Tax=Roseinatronobacter sp. NSM TaxID=3457785 RepID=UPI004037227A
MNKDQMAAQADDVAVLIDNYLKRVCDAREIKPEVALAGAHAQIIALMAITLGAKVTAEELRRAATEMDFFANEITLATSRATGRA